MSSFKRKSPNLQSKLPAGSRLSAHNGQVLTSTGLPALDDILLNRGGLPIGTVLLIESDRHTTYSTLLLKTFLSQGISHRHHVCIASADEPARSILASVPFCLDDGSSDNSKETAAEKEGAESSSTGSSSEKMTIAWRYQNLPKVNQGSNTAFRKQVFNPSQNATSLYCHNFDLTRRINPESVEKLSDTVTLLDVNDLPHDDENHDAYDLLYNRLEKLIDEGGFSATSPVPPGGVRNALRIGIHALASPFWQASSNHSLFKFLHRLRGLLRFSYACCTITVPTHLFSKINPHNIPDPTFISHPVHPPSIIPKLRHLSDFVIQLDSFSGSLSMSPALLSNSYLTSDYHGLFYIHKLPRLNSLVSSSSKVSITGIEKNLAFKVRRKRFTIESWSLPPELDDQPSRSQNKGQEEKDDNPDVANRQRKVLRKDTGKNVMAGCGSLPGRKDPLEF
ncbi:Elongator complex protein 4 [Paraphysoderma sedebokerense]|nr:Elongator complex protein 4 [Paraphysoderma sedebokerense]